MKPEKLALERFQAYEHVEFEKVISHIRQERIEAGQLADKLKTKGDEK